MSSINRGIEMDNDLLKSYIKQDVALRCSGISGMIAKFYTQYQGSTLVIYYKDTEAYISPDNRTPGYIRTIVVFNESNRKMSRTDVYKGRTVLIDLDDYL